MTDFDNQITNRFVDTQEPVTADDALKFEQESRAKSIERFHEKEAKKEMSNTDTGVMIKQQLLQDVERVLVEQIDSYTYNGGDKPSWWKRDDFQRKLKDSETVVGKIKPSIAADLALMVTLDGTSKEWSLRKLQEHLGHMHSCTLFDVVMRRTAPGRRMMDRLDKQVSEKTKDGERRGDIIWRKAASWGYDLSIWTEREKVKVGQILLNCVLKGTNLIDIVHEKRDKDNHLTRYPVFTEEAKLLIAEHRELLASFSSSFPPMIHPPRDWNADNLGPYLSGDLAIMNKMVRNMSPEQEAEIATRRKNNDLKDVEEAVSFIQGVAYTVNPYILDAVKWAFNHTAKGDLLKKFPDLIAAEPLEKLDADKFAALPKEQQMDRGRAYNFIQRYNRSVIANEATMSKQVGTAELMSKFDMFWLPHNFDYRGRIYHIPDFGHHNADYVRAMFLFAHGSPIGDREHHLAIQLANTFGNDKVTLDERVDWVKIHSDTIYRCGENYEAGFAHWSQASEPFQYLAACREWYHYKNIGPDYVCRLPIAKDATQSGIQHFAAASLNPQDGYKVNLTDNDKPFDFYEACLTEAKTILRSDLAQKKRDLVEKPWTDKERETVAEYEAFQSQEWPDDFEEAKKLAEEKDKNHQRFKKTTAYKKQQRDRDIDAAERLIALGAEYNRSVMKRNAMTYAYSSRQFGFAEQLRDDWMNDFTKEVRQGKRTEHPFGKDQGYHAAFYIAGIHERAIEQTIQSAASGMRFLQSIAAIMANDKSVEEVETAKTTKSGRHVRFENQMGFPMYQYYRHGTGKSQKVIAFDRKHNEYNSKTNSYFRKYSDKVKADKSGDGISPNLIHSQDGCHLMMTALAMKDAGANNFMVVHDSFATDIANVDTMERVLREQFVDLYSDYCLFADVLEQAKARHSDPDSVEWPEIPSKGQNGVLLDLNEVMRSKYFFN